MPGDFDSIEVQLISQRIESPPSTSPTAALISSRATESTTANSEDMVIKLIMSRSIIDSALIEFYAAAIFRCIINVRDPLPCSGSCMMQGSEYAYIALAAT